MQIRIDYQPQTETYNWKLYDGPDGIDFYQGNELDLGQCFEQIIIHRTLNARQYTD